MHRIAGADDIGGSPPGDLARLLTRHGVSTLGYGSGRAKSLAQLWVELREGESDSYPNPHLGEIQGSEGGGLSTQSPTQLSPKVRAE